MHWLERRRLKPINFVRTAINVIAAILNSYDVAILAYPLSEHHQQLGRLFLRYSLLFFRSVVVHSVRSHPPQPDIILWRGTIGRNLEKLAHKILDRYTCVAGSIASSVSQHDVPKLIDGVDLGSSSNLRIGQTLQLAKARKFF